jgi:tripartite-type tricarboxylate transporter receptor subunit TctC
MRIRFQLLSVLPALICSTAFASNDFPDKSHPIRIIVPFGAASSTDLLARALAQGIAEVSGQPAAVENKAGAEGVIGMVAVKEAKPDGYTLLMTSSSTQVLNPFMLRNLPYDPVKDYVPVSGVARFSLVVNAGQTVPFKTARELIEAAKQNPGKYSFGSGTTTTRLAGELLQHEAGIQMLSVPYKSMAEAMTGLAGGQVDLVIVDLPSASPQYKSGRVRSLAVTGPTRMQARPDLPTMQEEGVKTYEMTGWWAAYYPRGTSPAIVAKMGELIGKAAKTSVVKQTFSTF